MVRTVRSNIVPNRIREVRLRRGMSLDALGGAIGVNFSTVAKLEKSQRTLSLDILSAIARALEVPPAELIGSSNGTPPDRLVPIADALNNGDWEAGIAEPLGHVAVPDAPANAFALYPANGAMDLLIVSGGIIVIDPDDTDLRDNLVYAVTNPHGETTYMRFRSEPARLEPCASAAVPKSIPLGREPYQTIGRVIWQISPL